MEKYQRKMLIRVLRYAYNNTRFYKMKYDEAGVRIERIRDLRDLKDIDKIPFVSKEELSRASLDDLLPEKYKNSRGYKVSTSGSSGRPITIFIPIYESLVASIYAIRVLRAYGLNWRRSRVSNIGDFSIPRSSDEDIYRDLAKKARSVGLLGEHQMLSVTESGEELMREISQFKPDVIVGYTSVLINLALLRNEGLGEEIHPKFVISSGEILDKYSRKLIEDAFDTEVKNLYASTEGLTTAFECRNGKMHLDADLIYLETINEGGEKVYGERGDVVITKLLPIGIPIVRYTGLGDILSLSDEECNCGINTPVIKSLEGRRRESIILPNRSVIPPASIPLPLLESIEKFKVRNLERFQFYQDEINRLEVRLKFRGKLADKEKENFLKDVEDRYRELLGKDIEVIVREIDHLENPSMSSLPPLVISNIGLQ